MADFDVTYSALHDLMRPYATHLDCLVDEPGRLSLQTRHMMQNGKPLWFGGVEVRKRYVSYHLMPVYVQPGLLEGCSPELRKRMQGKSCFNFTAPDPVLFAELGELTRAGFEAFQERGYV